MHPGGRSDSSSAPNPAQSKVYAEAPASGTMEQKELLKQRFCPDRKQYGEGQMGGGGKCRIKYSQPTGLATEVERKGSAELKET